MGRTFVWVVIGGAFCGVLASACSDGVVVRDAPPGAGRAGRGSGGSSVGGANNDAPAGAGGTPEIPIGKGVGEAKSSLTSPVVVDAAANTLAIDKYTDAPVLLKVTR